MKDKHSVLFYQRPFLNQHLGSAIMSLSQDGVPMSPHGGTGCKLAKPGKRAFQRKGKFVLPWRGGMRITIFFAGRATSSIQFFPPLWPMYVLFHIFCKQ